MSGMNAAWDLPKSSVIKVAS